MVVKFFGPHTYKSVSSVLLSFRAPPYGLLSSTLEPNGWLWLVHSAQDLALGLAAPAPAHRQPRRLGRPQTRRGGPGLRHKGRPAPRARVPGCQAPGRPSWVRAAARGNGGRTPDARAAEGHPPAAGPRPLRCPRLFPSGSPVGSPRGRTPHSPGPPPRRLTSSSLSLRKHRHAARFL